MKRLIMIIVILSMVSGAGMVAQRTEGARKTDDFLMGISFLMRKDLDLTRIHLANHFRRNPQQAVKEGFDLLLADKRWDATRKFNSYLQNTSRPSFLEALIGISLAMDNMEGGGTLENLNRALRLSPNYAPAHLCLGYEHLRMENFVLAESSFSKAMKLTPLPEVKIWMAELLLRTGKPQNAWDLLKADAEANPQNFHLNAQLIRAAVQLHRLQEADLYIDRALKEKPTASEILLEKAKILISRSDWRGAKTILDRIKTDQYNVNYSLAMAEVFLQLNDAQAERYLYEAFVQFKWNPQLNRLFALFCVKKKRDDLQNWVTRAILAGVDRAELEKVVKQTVRYPQYPFFPLFSVKKLTWIDANLVAVAGKAKVTDSESLYLVSMNPMAIVNTFAYRGTMQDFFFSPQRDRLMLSTLGAEGDRMYLYQLPFKQPRYSLSLITPNPIRVASILGEFNPDGSEFYFCDGSFPQITFDSPFKLPGEMGKSISVYPRFSFPLFSFRFPDSKLIQIRDMQTIRKVPIGAIQKFVMVSDGFQNNPEIRQLIAQGQGLELTSGKFIKIYFDDNMSAMLFQYGDLENSFQGSVFEKGSNRRYRFDATMFLGKKKYAEMTVMRIDPQRQEVFLLTKDDDRDLFRFNYQSQLYDKMAHKVLDFSFWKSANRVYFLTEKKQNLYYSETFLETVLLNPYIRDKLTSRSNLVKIIGPDLTTDGFPLFSTYNGEYVKIDENHRFFVNFSIAFDGTPHAVSPDRKRIAAFINGRLYLMNWGS